MPVHSFRSLSDGTPCAGFARVLARRVHGGVAFLDARWNHETVQLMLRRGQTRDFEALRDLSLGSIVRFDGVKGTTRAGFPAVFVDAAEVTWRCARPLPDKHHGVSDERRQENRTGLLVVDDPTFRFTMAASDMATDVRRALLDDGFREFRTGVLQRFFEGGLAQPFTTVCRANGATYALSLTSELKLKRLIIAGADRVFDMAESFRNEGMDPAHSPEFTLLEAYAVGETCEGMMGLVERALRAAAASFFGWFPNAEDPDGLKAAFAAPFRRLSFHEAYAQFVDPDGFDDVALDRLVARFPDQFAPGMNRFTWVMKAIEKFVVPELALPTYLTALPAELSPLVKRNRDRPGESERSFLAVGRAFVADLYEDESDPEPIRAALEEQSRVTGRPVNDGYLDALSFGLPPTAGIGLGMNRLLMAFLPLAGLPVHIRETMPYPL